MMKYLPIILAALAAVSCGGPKPVETPAQKLHAKLSQSVKDGKILYGHQDDLAYGHAWKVEDWEADPLDRSDVKAVTGKYPAVMGVELGGIEMGDKASLDSVDFGLIRKAAKLHAERGGVVTVSWHPRNPLTGGDAWDVSSDQVVKSLLEGGELHDLFMDTWLPRLGDFLVSLGKTPVIFRPWHECSESWFWWGSKLCSADEYKALFRTTWSYLTETRGLKNLLWCYSPNGGIDADEYLERYPGDDVIDLMGLDQYEFIGPDGFGPSGERFAAEIIRSLGFVHALSIGQPVRDRPGGDSRSGVVDGRPVSRHQGLPDRVRPDLAQRVGQARPLLRRVGRLRERPGFQGVQRAGLHRVPGGAMTTDRYDILKN